jgi:hypothetical protein
MCIDDSLALHAKSKDGYIKHLESYLLDCGEFERCAHCVRIESVANMVPLGAECEYVCDTCLPAWERAEKEAQEIAESDERDYRDAKGRV